jgi:transcriptional regulator with XRE-family HTH domain
MSRKNDTHLAHVLRTEMKLRKLSAPELASRALVSLGTIKSILHGPRRNRNPSTLHALADALKIHVGLLCEAYGEDWKDEDKVF